MPATIASAADVIDFWFSPKVQSWWFAATPAFDAPLRAQFLETYRAAAAGRLTDWAATAEGALALTLVLDQFPLNMFRGQPASFATEAAARVVADQAIARGFDQALPPEQRQFLYLPFMHSETWADQERSVTLYQQPGLEEGLRFACVFQPHSATDSNGIRPPVPTGIRPPVPTGIRPPRPAEATRDNIHDDRTLFHHDEGSKWSVYPCGKFAKSSG